MGDPVADPCVSVTLVQQLYRSWTGYAEKLTKDQVAALHLSSSLDEAVAGALRAGDDVVLTGNPGDGKTHLMMLLQQRNPELRSVEWIRDATAVERDGSSATAEATIYREWIERRRAGIPTCIAINEGVLRELLRQTADDPLIEEIRRQLDGGIYYRGEPDAPSQRVLVLNLNDRSPLHSDFVRSALKNLIDSRFYPECNNCPARAVCAVPRNRHLLSAERTQIRVAHALAMVGRAGFHATMRDLQGMLGYMITGGLSCADLMRTREVLGTRFYDRMYDGDGPLFEALARTFDPGDITSPLTDDALWTGTYSGDGWEDAFELQPPPNSLSGEGESRRAMRSAKRAYYFLQQEGDEVDRFLPRADQEFSSLLDHAETRRGDSLRTILRLVNAFFQRDPTESELRIWTRHHFDVPPSRVYFSTRTLIARQLTLALPKAAPWQVQVGALEPDHVLLIARLPDDREARLRIDQQVFRGLWDAAQGQPFALRTAELIKALERFLASAGNAAQVEEDVADVFVESFKTGQSRRFRVYPLERRYGN